MVARGLPLRNRLGARSSYPCHMSEADRATALRRLEQARRVREMVAILEALLEGRMSTAEASEWAGQAWRGEHIALYGAANAVRCGLGWIDQLDAQGRAYVGEREFRAYLDALRGGETFMGEPEPVLGLAIDIEQLAARFAVPVAHWAEEGIGWIEETRFAIPASGRTYRGAVSAGIRGKVAIYKQRHVALLDAVIDLFEGLEIDERDAILLHPQVELAQLPEWALWRVDHNSNQFEIDRSRSYAKLDAFETRLRNTGHRQSYWIDPA
jgi:hypothetical protein